MSGEGKASKGDREEGSKGEGTLSELHGPAATSIGGLSSATSPPKQGAPRALICDQRQGPLQNWVLDNPRT